MTALGQLVAKQEAELALRVNNASYQGDLVQLKQLVIEGAIVVRADYDGRMPLHLAASKGFESVVLYLIREGADVNAIDKFGVSPLQEAVRGGHDNCLLALMDSGAQLRLQDEDVFALDYDDRTALHLAAAEGSEGLARMLIDTGADNFAQDRWGRTPLDEAVLHHHSSLAEFLKDAQKNQLELTILPAKSDAELASHRLEQKSFETQGHENVEWVPPNVEEILKLASKHFGKVGTMVLNQDTGEISSTEFIMDSEKVYIVDKNDTTGSSTS
ncbi:unnamed protein product [Calypogeia fissa]